MDIFGDQLYFMLAVNLLVLVEEKSDVGDRLLRLTFHVISETFSRQEFQD
jgi:hypothetical protein